jgi:hypothetical protein
LAISSLSVSPCHSSLKICWSFCQSSYCFISYQPGDETRFVVVSLPIFVFSQPYDNNVGCRHFVQDSKPHAPVCCVWGPLSHKLCTRLCLSNVQDSQTCCQVYKSLKQHTWQVCDAAGPSDGSMCSQLQALPTFCFSIFCIFLQYAATCSSCSVGHEIYVYIYIYNFVMANSITFRIDCCHPSRNKKGLLFFS